MKKVPIITHVALLAALIACSETGTGTGIQTAGEEPVTLTNRESATYTLVDQVALVVDLDVDCAEGGALFSEPDTSRIDYRFYSDTLDWNGYALTGGTPNVLEGTWSRKRDVDEDDIHYTEVFQFNNGTLTQTRTTQYCLATQVMTRGADLENITYSQDGCSSVTATSADGQSATFKLLSMSSDGSETTYSVTYKGKSCTITDVDVDEPTVQICKDTWARYQASGNEERYYWDEYLNEEDEGTACAAGLDIPNDLLKALKR